MIHGHHKVQLYKFVLLPVLFVILTWLRASSMSEVVVPQLANPSMTQSTHHLGAQKTFLQPQQGEWKPWRVIGGLEDIMAIEFLPNGVDAVIGTRSYVLIGDVISNHFKRFIFTPASIMAVSNNGLFLLTVGGNLNIVHLWDITTGKHLKQHEYERPIASITFSPDSTQFLVSTQYGGFVDLYDVVASQRSKRFAVSADHTNSLAFTQDGTRFAVGGGQEVQLWDISTAKAVQVFRHDNTFAWSVAMPTANSSWLLVGTSSGVFVWDINTGQQVMMLTGGGNELISKVALSSDGKQIMTITDSGEIHLWDVSTKNIVHKFSQVFLGSFSPSSQHILIGNSPSLNLFDRISGQLISSVFPKVEQTTSIDISADRKYLLTGHKKCNVRIWDINTGQIVQSYLLNRSEYSEITVSEFSPDGRYALNSCGGELWLWDVTTGKTVHNFNGNLAVTATFSPNGQVVAGAAGAGIALWNTNDGSLIKTLTGGSDNHQWVTFSPDGTQLLSGDGWRAYLWNIAQGIVLRDFKHTGNLETMPYVAFSANGEQIYTALANIFIKDLTAWDKNTGTIQKQYIERFGSFERYVTQGILGVSPSEEVAIGNSIVNMVTGEIIKLAAGGVVNSATFSRDGLLFAGLPEDSYPTQDYQSNVWIWSIAEDIPNQPNEIIPLSLGDAQTNSTKTGNWLHYAIPTEANRQLLVAITPLANVEKLALYSHFEKIPPPYQQSVFNLSPRGRYELLLSPTRSGTYYFSVLGWKIVGESGNFRIQASYVDRYILDITPRRGGNVGVSSFLITGADFVNGTQMQLRNSALTIPADSTEFSNRQTLIAGFNLTGKPTGMYDLHAIWPDGQTQTIPNAFEIVAGQGAKLDATLVAPEVYRPQRVYPLTIQYANIGDADLPAPLFVVSAQPSLPLRTLCDTAWRNGPIQLLGLNPTAPLDRLPPGSNGVTHAQFEGGEENLTFQLDVMDASPQPVPWDSFKTSMRPTAISEAEWNTLWPQLTARLGATWADYLKVLHRNAQRLRQQSDTSICVPDLLMMEVDALRGKGLAAISGKVINAATGNPLLGVDIGARQEGGAVVRLIATDLLDGSFTFANLPDGNYQLSVEGHVLDPKVIVPIANHQDALGIQVAARPYVPPPTPTAPKPADSQPALTVYATGNAHMVWQRDGEIWYARYNEQGQWAETQPISNAIGTDPVIAYDSKLVGGSAPGLAVVWEADDGTGSYLKQSIAPMTGNTVNGWSTAADVTNSQQSDGQAALTALANGQPLVLWLQRDMKQDDDTDLYYKPLDTNTLIVIGAGQPNVQNLPDFLPRAETCQGVEFDRFSDIDPKLPIIGGKYLMKIAGKSCYEQTGVPICKLNISGDLAAEFGKETWSGRNGYNQVRKTSVSGKAALTANSITDIDVCRYIVDQVDVDFNLAGNFDVSAEKIPIISAINAIPYLRVQLGATLGVNGGGRLSWQNMTNPLGEYDVVGNARFGLAGGVYGLIEAFDGAVGARVDGNAAINLCYADQLTLCPGEAFCVAANATFKSMLITHSWAYKAGSCASAIQSVSHSSIANSAQTVTLIQTLQLGETPVHETLVMQIDPLVGTGNVYEGQTVLANLGSDVTNDSQPATIRTDNGSILAAWTKDSPNLNLSIGSSVVVAEYDGARWLPPNELQGPTRFNSDAAIVLPPGNQPMVLWASAPANVTLTSAITDVINNMNATDIFFSRRTGATWSAPTPVATVPGTDRTVQIAATPNGEVMAAWLHTNGNNIYDIYTSYWNGSSWSTPVTIATETYVESLAAAYVHNQILLVWSQKTDNSVPSYNDLTLFHAVWQNGSWSTPTPMDKSANIVNAADLAELARQNSTLRLEIPEYPPQECCQECAPDAPNCHYISPPPPFTFPVDTTPSTNVRSLDPNEKLGLAGQGDQHVVAPGAPLRYTIFFENMATASAPAQEVFITDQLDTNLDLTTLHFEEVTIADRVIPVVDESLGQFHIRQSIPDYRSNINKTWWVDITGQLEPVTRVITWTLRILDPETGDLPVDALAGFLPPNDATGRGEGHVTFSIHPNANTTLGTRINNKAAIVFDTNPPIITNEVFNTIDNVVEGAGRIYLPVVWR